jgi:hypothetical protein
MLKLKALLAAFLFASPVGIPAHGGGPAASAINTCELEVYYEEGDIVLVCTEGNCGDPSSSCDFDTEDADEIVYTVCECPDGSQAPCTSGVGRNGGTLQFTCFNPCAESCDIKPEGVITGATEESPIQPCFCDN